MNTMQRKKMTQLTSLKFQHIPVEISNH